MLLRGPVRPDLLRKECLGDILRATARRRPEHAALIWGDRVVTYAELDALSDAVACELIARGAKRGAVIGLHLPRGADLLIAQAAIAKSGAAWLPLDATTPCQRIGLCLRSRSLRIDYVAGVGSQTSAGARAALGHRRSAGVRDKFPSPSGRGPG